MEKSPDNLNRICCRRRDRLTAQRVEVGLVFLEMLGLPDASDYLNRSGVARSITERILDDSDCRRTGSDCWITG
jgi:hypothetical protein